MAIPSESPTNTIARPKSSGFSLMAASAAEPVYATAIPAPMDEPATAIAAPMNAPDVSDDDAAVSWNGRDTTRPRAMAENDGNERKNDQAGGAEHPCSNAGTSS